MTTKNGVMPNLEQTGKTEHTPSLFLLTAETVQFLPELLAHIERRQWRVCALPELLFPENVGRELAAVLLWDCPLHRVAEYLPLLQEKRVVLNLFSRSLPSRKDWNTVKNSQTFRFYTSFDAEKPTPFVFCNTVPQQLSFLLAHGVHTLLVREETQLPPLPDGMNAWHVTPFPAQMQSEVCLSEADACRLPLEKTPLFSDPSLAIPLAILGGDENRLDAFLTFADWRPCLERETLCYTLQPNWSGLLIKRAEPRDSAEVLRFLKQGVYVRICAKDGGLPDCVLYGFDPREKVFFGWSPVRHDLCITVQALDDLCLAARGTVTLLKPLPTDLDGSHDDSLSDLCDRFANGFRDGVSLGKPYHGWQASVVFTNLLQGRKTLPTASALTFLEERFAVERQFRLVRQRTGFCLEPLDRLSELLCTDAAVCLQQLRDESDSEECFAPSVYDLFRRLLNAEEACRSAFLTEWASEESLAAFCAETYEKRMKNVKVEENVRETLERNLDL